MWESEVEGKRLTFHLAGINNQNFIMRDEETGSWWQQVSGEAIHGPLKGKKLTNVYNDELTFAVWKRENRQGRVLKPDERVKRYYIAANWEEQAAKVEVVTPVNPKDGAVGSGGGVTPIFIVLGDDNKSVRAFDRTVDGRTLEFYVKPGTSPVQLTDETATTWDFSGKAVSGPLAGKQLKKIFALKDYWFDWKIYHPDTTVYTLGE